MIDTPSKFVSFSIAGVFLTLSLVLFVLLVVNTLDARRSEENLTTKLEQVMNSLEKSNTSVQELGARVSTLEKARVPQAKNVSASLVGAERAAEKMKVSSKQSVEYYEGQEFLKKLQLTAFDGRYKQALEMVEKHEASGASSSKVLINIATLSALSIGDCRKAKHYARRAMQALKERVAAQCE